MTMMISKFHKLIQSKVVWYIVLGVIVIAFVGFFTPTMGNKIAKKKEQVVGEMFGKKIFSQDYRQAQQHTTIWYILSTARQPETPEQLAALKEQAWQRLIALHKAAEEKVIVSNQEIIQQIQRMPIFMNKQGVFDKNAYNAVLGQIGISWSQVENTVREQVALQKMAYSPVQAALISPRELERAYYHMYSDRIILDYAVFTSEMLDPNVPVSREEAEAFFAENREAFRMPAKVHVSYVEYPVADFLEQAEIPEGAVLQFYNQNLDRYRIETTGDVAAVEYKAFEDVEAEITEIVAQYGARRLAVEAATSLVADIAPKAQDDSPDFKGAATAAGLTLQTLPAFGPSDELPGIDATSPFKQAALGLQEDIYSSFSDAVIGKDSVYVISLEQRYESFLPGFEIVEKEATEAARARAAGEAGAARVIEIRDAVAAALKTGSDFKAAVEPYGVDIQSSEEFDLTSPPETDYADALMRASIDVEQGALCKMVPVEEGVLFAYVAQRTAIDSDIGLPALRDELIQGLSGVRAQRLAADWRTQMAEDAGFQIISE